VAGKKTCHAGYFLVERSLGRRLLPIPEGGRNNRASRGPRKEKGIWTREKQQEMGDAVNGKLEEGRIITEEKLLHGIAGKRKGGGEGGLESKKQWKTKKQFLVIDEGGEEIVSRGLQKETTLASSLD